jgi:hypothetical protein
MKRIMTVVLAIAMANMGIAAQGQDAATTTPKPHKRVAVKKGPTVSDQLTEMKQAIDAQQAQIKQLADLVQTRDQKISTLEQRLDQSQAAATQAQSKADAAVAQNADEQQAVMALKSDVTDLKTTATSNAMTLQETQKNIKDTFGNPMAIHYKGVTITPGGFLAGETVYRTHGLGADATPFNSLNMPGSGANAVSEFYGSGRQSQITMRADGKIADAKLTGYYEADFLASAVTSNNNQTNSYALRQRQLWGLMSFDNGWSFTAGQMWTLMTENRKGIDNLQTARPMTIDPNYTVGFTFARQYGARVVKNFNNKVWLAASIENPQTTFTVTNANPNFALGSPGAGGSLYNNGGSSSGAALANYSFNATPDFILKAAFEPRFGHYEIFAIGSRFRDRVYPCYLYQLNPSLCGTTGSTPTGAYNASKNGGGVGGNARVSFANKHVDFGLHAFYGNGEGRYAASTLPDATVNPDGTLALLRTYQGLATLEFHYPKIDIYFNGGEDYVGRHWSIDPVSGKPVGYGSNMFNDSNCYTETLPGSGGYAFGGLTCSGQTQSVIEGTFGFWIKTYNGPKGRIQFGPQYSYISRNAWAGSTSSSGAGPSTSPHGVENMFYTSFRYYLP